VNIIERVKVFTAKYYLSKHKNNVLRNRKISNLNEAKSIGIVYKLEDETTYNHITRFVKLLQDKQINVKAIGYFEGNVRPIYAIEKLSLDFYDKKDINWFNKPSGKYVNDFIKTEFDILIDLSIEDIYQTKFISTLSRAKFKVGKGGGFNTEIFDLMIDLNQKTTLDEFIILIVHYLSIINKKEND